MITQADIAKIAGVSQRAVSSALRGDPRISAETQNRVEQIAKELGYQINPLLHALMECRRQGKKPALKRGLTVAYVHDAPLPLEQWQHDFPRRAMWEVILAMRTRLLEQGIGLDVFWLHDFNGESAQMEKVIRARGIRGVVLGLTRDHDVQITLDWPHYALLALSHHFKGAGVDRVRSDHFEGMRLLLTKLEERGCKRIGLCTHRINNNVSHQAMSAAFHQQQSLLPEARRVPLMLFEQFDEKTFLRWQKRNRVDAVITIGLDLLTLLRAKGIRVPGQVSLASFNLNQTTPEWSGLNLRTQSLGETAADIMVHKLVMHQTGLREVPRVTLVAPAWIDGMTTRPLK